MKMISAGPLSRRSFGIGVLSTVALGIAPRFARAGIPYSTVGAYLDGDSKTVGVSNVGGTVDCVSATGVHSPGCSLSDFGHGIAPGTGAYVQQPANIPTQVQTAMLNAFGAGTFYSENHGVGGATCVMSNTGTGYYDPASPSRSDTAGPLVDRLRATHCLVIVGMFLANDFARTPSQFYKDIVSWIYTVQNTPNADGQQLYACFMEESPMCQLSSPDLAPYAAARTAALSDMSAMLIQQHDAIASNSVGLSGDWKTHLPDCVHEDNDMLTIEGNRAANAMAGLVQALLGR